MCFSSCARARSWYWTLLTLFTLFNRSPVRILLVLHSDTPRYDRGVLVCCLNPALIAARCPRQRSSFPPATSRACCPIRILVVCQCFVHCFVYLCAVYYARQILAVHTVRVPLCFVPYFQAHLVPNNPRPWSPVSFHLFAVIV